MMRDAMMTRRPWVSRGAGRDVSSHRGRSIGAPHRHGPAEPGPSAATPSIRSCWMSSARPSRRWPPIEAARVVVLRGSGRHFCTGADLTRAPQPRHAARCGRAPSRCGRCWRASTRCRSRPLAVVHGAAVGGGAAFAACCDAVIAAEDAFFSIPEVRVGMPPARRRPVPGARDRPSRLSAAMASPAERITAAGALRLGLAHQSLRRTRSADLAPSPMHSCRARLVRSGTLKSAAAQLRVADVIDHSWPRNRPTTPRPQRRWKESRASAKNASQPGIRSETARAGDRLVNHVRTIRRPFFVAPHADRRDCAPAECCRVLRSTKPPGGRGRLVHGPDRHPGGAPVDCGVQQEISGIEVRYARADSGPTAIKIITEARAGRVQSDVFDGIDTTAATGAGRRWSSLTRQTEADR